MTLAVVQREWAGPAGEVAKLNAMLADLAPPSERDFYLWAYWEPGDEWMPVERIVIAQVTPRKLLVAEDRFYRAMGAGSDASVLAELEGPNPRFGGHYDAQLGQFVHDPNRPPPNITERQWLLYRAEGTPGGGLAIPKWIVQGREGGTPRRYSLWEQELARVERRATRPPYPGQLDYAPADDRVREALLRHFAAQSRRVREDWFRLDDEERTEDERELASRFDTWYSGRNDDRARGLVTDAAYNPVTKTVDVADYSKIS